MSPSASDSSQKPQKSGQSECPICHRSFSVTGFTLHYRSCSNKQEEKRLRRDFKNQEKLKGEGAHLQEPEEERTAGTPQNPAAQDSCSFLSDDFGEEEEDANDITTSNLQQHCFRDIKIVHHPHSRRPDEIMSLERYHAKLSSKPKVSFQPPQDPFLPFSSRAEFEFAEVALKAALNKSEVDALIRIIQRCVRGEDKFELYDHDQLLRIWDEGSVLHTAPEKHVISSVYTENDIRSFDFWCQNIWEWVLEIVQDPFLCGHMQWDAQRTSVYNGEKFVPFVDEPYTGTRFWNVQSELPEEGKPICIQIYSDKTQLALFGKAKGYPVFVRLANLSADVRNSQGRGGAELVGWLPIVPEDEHEKGKKGYVDFKRVVWHDSFKKGLESIAQYSKTGYWAKCGDQKTRYMFPFVFLFAGDYEEQCVMGQNRGKDALEPCPVCHVPNSELHNCGVFDWPLRTGIETAEIVAKAQTLNVTQGEALLKKNGIRPIENAFMTVQFSDPHEILSWDRMHCYSHGLGGKHLWPAVRTYIRASKQSGLGELDKRFNNMPPWPDLKHFDQVVSVDYTDASKLKDIVKILLFNSHDLIDSKKFKEGPLLLSCLRAYLNLFMYTGFNLHTAETIEEGKQEMKYSLKSTLQSDKTWNIPKQHQHVHVWADIMAKGVTRTYNSKIFEPLHGPIKIMYRFMIDKKNVDADIMKFDQMTRVAKTIRYQIDCYDGKYDEPLDDFDEEDEWSRENKKISKLGSSKAPSNVEAGHIILGSVQKKSSFASVEKSHKEDTAFHGFQRRFHQYVSNSFTSKFNQMDIDDIMDSTSLTTIVEYRYLKVKYISEVTWKPEINRLRCNPNFNKKPRFDNVLVKVGDGTMIAQLVFVFTAQIGKNSSPWALIHPFNAFIGQPTKYETDLQLYRVHAKIRSAAQFIPVEDIIRGVMLIPTYKKEDDYYIFDLVDEDLFVRVRKLWNSRLNTV
ncbi:hypothetical protein JR316_0010862 [Psilocybe cubensis]|uniref:Uncharacterized protein n=2 Tax=Psilocybe cubensis TaxID=181762 RepID=A0ACB8GMP6_PSICU|nr:hypothetical protein JR316_0010862 [Psilocybe cubensis]KAH9476946.1 hypothetical protein JR316_0010862 [Psilocybe cubensis]